MSPLPTLPSPPSFQEESPLSHRSSLVFLSPLPNCPESQSCRKMVLSSTRKVFHLLSPLVRPEDLTSLPSPAAEEPRDPHLPHILPGPPHSYAQSSLQCAVKLFAGRAHISLLKHKQDRPHPRARERSFLLKEALPYLFHTLLWGRADLLNFP